MSTCSACPSGPHGCTRCGARACMEHQPMPGALCERCELAYHDDKGRLHLNRWFVVGFALPWLCLLGIRDHLPSWSARTGGMRAITTGIPMLDVLIMTAVTAVFAGTLAVGLRGIAHRRRFLSGRMAAR